MRLFIFLVLLAALFKSASGSDYRHIKVNKKRETSFYVSLGLLFPYNARVTDVSSLNFDNIEPNSEILNLVLDRDSRIEAVPYTIEQNKNAPLYFSKNRIGAGVALGYKSSYLWRTDFSMDFATVTHTFQFTEKVRWLGDITDLSDTPPNGMDAVLRQFSFLGNFFIDFDNPTNITPFIGAGAGFTTNQSFIQIITNKVYREPESSLISNLYFTYEIKWGIRLGTRKAFTNIEFYQRKTPKIEYETKGVRTNFGFRI